ncbi:MAG: hypothetical protein ABSG65_14460 [Bryobacteraceae bacterium]
MRLDTGLDEPDYAHAKAIYPLVSQAMDEGLCLPNRGSNLLQPPAPRPNGRPAKRNMAARSKPEPKSS